MSVVFNDGDLDSFQNFISNKTMFQFAITLVIASHLKQTTYNISESILTPIIDKITDSKINKLNINIFGIDFYLGKIISNLLTFILIMLILYVFIKATKIDKKLQQDDNKNNSESPKQSATKIDTKIDASSSTIKLNI